MFNLLMTRHRNNLANMNLLVRKFTLWLSEIVIACFLEIFLEVFVHMRNRCIEVFNLNIRPFDIEYLFDVSNVYKASSIHHTKDLKDDHISSSLDVVDDGI